MLITCTRMDTQTYKTNKKQREAAARYYQENKAKVADYYRTCLTDEQKEKRKQKTREWKERNKAITQGPRYKLVIKVLSRFKRLGAKPLASAEGLLGCSVDSFLAHIESKWEIGMSWDNYGSQWELDHIKPVRTFDITTLEGQKACQHYTNWQPLWKSAHYRKTYEDMPNGRRPQGPDGKFIKHSTTYSTQQEDGTTDTTLTT